MRLTGHCLTVSRDSLKGHGLLLSRERLKGHGLLLSRQAEGSQSTAIKREAEGSLSTAVHRLGAQSRFEQGGGMGSHSLPHFPPPLINHTVSVDVKHQ